ncbi:Hypothetical_protein [Hexamita inflata]|uniref:Hypothetical_protein n=1 Tax=Hexamita inflata TaxID=28002 RepID=A0AA86NLM3_9EUKA|nr:Hypothetical protein HINF_LOCUS9049 [Hexamita inflata]
MRAPQQCALNGTVHHEPLNSRQVRVQKHTTLAARTFSCCSCLTQLSREFCEPKDNYDSAFSFQRHRNSASLFCCWAPVLSFLCVADYLPTALREKLDEEQVFRVMISRTECDF